MTPVKDILNKLGWCTPKERRDKRKARIKIQNNQWNDSLEKGNFHQNHCDHPSL